MDRRSGRTPLVEPRACAQDYGLNAIRLRVWVDPKEGWCGKADTLVKAKRAVAAETKAERQ